MVGRIKDNNIHNNYGCYANGAVKAERNGEFAKAAELWAKVLRFARSSTARSWADYRGKFCTNAAQRGWGVPDGRAAV